MVIPTVPPDPETQPEPTQTQSPQHQHWRLTILTGIISIVNLVIAAELLSQITQQFSQPFDVIFTIEPRLWWTLNITSAIGLVSFFVFAALLTTIVAQTYTPPTGRFTFIKSALAYFLTLCLLPIAAMIRISRSRRSLLSKAFIFLVSLFILLPVWGFIYTGLAYSTMEHLDLVTDYVPVTGTGSMYPTFPKGEAETDFLRAQEVASIQQMHRFPTGITLLGQTFFDYQLQHGDIVSFDNEQTQAISAESYSQSHGFIKRIVGLPGDILEIRDGLLYRNQQPLVEPYIATARSTFGGETLAECQQLTVPDGKIFVAGDNRKGSHDSRHKLGLVDITDVDHVIPWAEQAGVLDQYYRDTDHDLDNDARIHFDIDTYITQLNAQRTLVGHPPLKHQPLLDKSAAARATTMLEFDDLSFEATASGYTMRRAMNDVGYDNIVYGEAPSQGYYTAEEMIENQFAFKDSAKFLLDSDYQDIGIAAVQGQLNGCPAQIIVQHLAGYLPPDYAPEDINSWRQALDSLRQIQPGWNRLTETGEFYQQHQADIDRLNSLIDQRITNIASIVSTMDSNRWLTADQRAYAETLDYQLYTEQNELARKLNNL